MLLWFRHFFQHKECPGKIHLSHSDTRGKLSQTFAVGCTGGYWVHLPSVKIVLLMKIQVISGRKHAWLQCKGPVPLLPVTILLILHSEWNSSPALSPMCVFCSETVFHSSNFVPLTELPRVSYERRWLSVPKVR